MVRRQRLVASLLAVFAIVFAQLAVAAHWCETARAPAPAEPIEVIAHNTGCHEVSTPQADTNGNLCQAHCQYGSVSVDNGSPVPPAVDVAGPVIFLLVPASEPASSLRRAERFASAAAPPPPAILFGVLRI
jgi:hypothetical protein